MKKNHVILVSALLLMFLIVQAPALAGFCEARASENQSDYDYCETEGFVTLHCHAQVWTKGGDAWAHAEIDGGLYLEATADCCGNDSDSDDQWRGFWSMGSSWDLSAETIVLGTGGALAYAQVEW